MGMKTGTKELFKRMVRAGRRTYFISVRETENDKKYVTISESRLVDKNKFERFNLLVFSDKLAEFVTALQDAYAIAA
ncbi:MAG: PUR family DNA/RNA-binding protein [Candidatus Margulisbacteria bacterium]|nr:PUR family DNA/RNA-binding protein [Candidatus Margulisiibacteriota bacterium]